MVERFFPLLRASAEYRLGKQLRVLFDPEDIVNDVWERALPRLPELGAREARYTPVLLKFLATTLVRRINELYRRHIKGKPSPVPPERFSLENIPASPAGPFRQLARKEAQDLVTQAIQRLSPRDRELMILRGIEGHPYKEIAAVLGADPQTLPVRYQRALARLRRELPGSVYDELTDE
ncbi:MAG: sigma-70 family RNA polymerase sigma factor [Planctomycetes bacterium]|nr:sigma-70 family RNA polymerase sigma factor [Planctomycetota bacterium]